MPNRIRIPLIALFFASFNLQAQDASSHPLFADDWLVRLGGQQADAEVKAGLANPQLGEIPIIDIAAQGSDTTVTSFWGNVLWQAPQRWSIGLSYFRAEADGRRILDSDFSFGDLTIPAGTGVTGEFSTDFYVLNGYYDFYQAPARSAGIGLGVYALDLGFSLATQVGGQATGQRESADVLAPLPTISAYYKHAFNDKWAILADVSWLSANIDKYDGDVLAARLSVDYWINARWGLGAGYTFVDLELTVDEPIFDQRYEVQYNSFFLYATFGF